MKNLLNLKFGKLKVIEFLGKDNFKKPIWKCICDCGNKHIIKGEKLTRKNGTLSCGCLRIKSITKHNMSKSSEYKIWYGMLDRCNNLNNKRYKDYGGRGITVCDEWLKSFENFYKDMGNRPLNTSLDRINTNSNYSKNNCKWSTKKEQSNNTRTNHYITFNNVTKTISQWADYLKIKRSTLQSRIDRKWNIEKAFNKKGDYKHES